MAFLINEQKLVEDSVFVYEDRLNSPISRFLDKSPTFVTYYHINYQETTLDGGYRHVEELIGEDSPIKFQKIENFPLYGIEGIILNLQETDQGLDSDYSGEAVLLPNTIKPFPNDFFMISYLQDSYIFRVTEINYDNIRPDNFYKINFRLEFLDTDKQREMENQVHEEFECILENIGTENTCLIKKEMLGLMEDINSMYNDMLSTYKTIFYSERYNCFLCAELNGNKIYDPLQSIFFNKHKLLVKKNDLETVVLGEGFVDPKRKLKYEKSLYRIFERRDLKLIHELKYNLIPGTFKRDSAFYRWHDQSIQIVDIPTIPNISCDYVVLPERIANSFKLNEKPETKYINLMQKFIRKESIIMKDIPLDLHEELLSLENDRELFFYTPILLYIIKMIVNAGE